MNRVLLQPHDAKELEDHGWWKQSAPFTTIVTGWAEHGTDLLWCIKSDNLPIKLYDLVSDHYVTYERVLKNVTVSWNDPNIEWVKWRTGSTFQLTIRNGEIVFPYLQVYGVDSHDHFYIKTKSFAPTSPELILSGYYMERTSEAVPRDICFIWYTKYNLKVCPGTNTLVYVDENDPRLAQLDDSGQWNGVTLPQSLSSELILAHSQKQHFSQYTKTHPQCHEQLPQEATLIYCEMNQLLRHYKTLEREDQLQSLKDQLDVYLNTVIPYEANAMTPSH